MEHHPVLVTCILTKQIIINSKVQNPQNRAIQKWGFKSKFIQETKYRHLFSWKLMTFKGSGVLLKLVLKSSAVKKKKKKTLRVDIFLHFKSCISQTMVKHNPRDGESKLTRCKSCQLSKSISLTRSSSLRNVHVSLLIVWHLIYGENYLCVSCLFRTRSACINK